MNISKLAFAGAFAATLGSIMPAGLAHAGPLGLSASATAVAPPAQVENAYYRRHWRGHYGYRPYYYRHAYRAYPRYHARPYYYPSYGYYPRHAYPGYGWPGPGYGWGW